MNEEWIDQLRSEPVDLDPRPGFKDELRTRIVAERNGPTPTGAPPTRGDRRRWLLVAAAGCVALLIGALFVFGSDDRTLAPSTVPEQAPVTDAVSVPSTDTDSPTTTVADEAGPPTIDELRFSDPLGLDAVALLDPAPLQPVTASAAVGNTIPDVDWAWARDGSTDVWVLDDGEWAGMISVTDFAIPWEVATSGLTTTVIGDVDAVVDPELAVVALRRPDGVRRIQGGLDGPGGGDPALLDASTRLAELVGIGPLDAELPTDEFVPITRVEALSPSVTYDFSVQVQIVRFEQPPTIDELRWGAAMVARSNDHERIGPWAFVAQQGSNRQQLVELVSPVDAVVIDAQADADIGAYRDSLEFTTIAESGLAVDDRPGEASEVVARGEQEWGRWTVKRSPDGICQSLTTAEWTPGGLEPFVLATEPTCSDTSPPSPLVCDTNALRTIVVVIGADAATLTLEDRFASAGFVDGEGGAAALVERDPLSDDGIVVRVDDLTLTC